MEDTPIARDELPIEAMLRLFNDYTEGNGTTIITASGGYDYALESDVFKGGHGALTAAVLSSFGESNSDEYGHSIRVLHGDLNNDGAISVSELKIYIQQYVSEATSNLQKPTIRADNLKNDFGLWEVRNR